jgi:hypothetical protein
LHALRCVVLCCAGVCRLSCGYGLLALAHSQALFIANLIMRKLRKRGSVKPYIPDFKQAFHKVGSRPKR